MVQIDVMQCTYYLIYESRGVPVMVICSAGCGECYMGLSEGGPGREHYSPRPS